jgi:SNF family Na+-dependent transporter
MNINNDNLTDFLSYNAATGQAVFSVSIGNAGDQKVVRDVVAAKGWTSIVPMNIDKTGSSDLLSYNAATGQAVFSVGIGNAGDQKVVRDVVAAKGWTSIVPMDIDNDFPGLTDLVSYNAATGQAVFSVGIGNAGDQKVVRDVVAAKGWTSIVPMSLDGFPPTDLLSYNAATGQAVFSVGIGMGDQKVVRDVVAAKGWTSIVPMSNGINLTGLVSYNAKTGHAVFSIATDPIPPR